MHSKSGVNLRAVLIVAMAVITYLLSNKDFLHMIPAWGNIALGATMAGLIAFRGWLDQSASNVRPEPGTASPTIETPDPAIALNPNRLRADGLGGTGKQNT